MSSSVFDLARTFDPTRAFDATKQLLRSVSDSGTEEFDVAGRVVVITGAGAGIGRALAERLYRAGALLALIDIDERAAATVGRSMGERALAVRADVSDRIGMREAFAKVRERFGRIDVVVANAGVAPRPSTIRQMSPADFDRVIGINLTGVFNTVRPALEDVIEARGHVLVVSSVAAFTPGMTGSAYMVSKAATEQFGRALRVELAAVGATAGVAYLGAVDTAMTKEVFDDGGLGSAMAELLPWPLNGRLDVYDAAQALAEAIATRAPRVVAPPQWEVYSLLRGVFNVVLDHRLARDLRVHELIRHLERKVDTKESVRPVPH
ncbi:short-chain dehydrogenase/reductase [Nocardia callitridis]